MVSQPGRQGTGSQRGSKRGRRGDGKPEAGLWIVATPIGNLGDITLRALEVLRSADRVFCEDTRVTGKLLAACGIETRPRPYHEHNAARIRPAIIGHLNDGETVALIADAGTPLVSDPGFGLVREAVAQGIPVHAAPGASAVLAALVVSGLPTDRFLFAGFPPSRPTARKKVFAELAGVPATLVFFESARRLPASLADMAAVFGDRPAAVARELTKLHEEVRRDRLPGLAAGYRESGPPRGEVVVVVDRAPPDAGAATEEEIDALLARALAGGSVRDAVQTVAGATGRPRREIYRLALALDRKRPS